jgi:ABC-type nitrate/sulfonate/bicarbonate transport system, permease component
LSKIINSKPKKKKQVRLSDILAPVVAFGVILGSWQFLVTILKIPTWQLPLPSNVIKSMILDFKEFAPNIWITYSTIVAGFVIAVVFGVILAAFINNFRILGTALTPYINMLCTTPMITLVPLLMLWMGFGIGVKILAVVLQAFPIVNMNSCTGFTNVETMKLELMQSLRANRVKTFFRCIFPDSLPSVFTGMKLSGIFAVIACISTEFTGGSQGLGAQIIAYTQFMKMDKAFACIFYVAIIGLVLYGITSYLEKKVIKWKI